MTLLLIDSPHLHEKIELRPLLVAEVLMRSPGEFIKNRFRHLELKRLFDHLIFVAVTRWLVEVAGSVFPSWLRRLGTCLLSSGNSYPLCNYLALTGPHKSIYRVLGHHFRSLAQRFKG